MSYLKSMNSHCFALRYSYGAPQRAQGSGKGGGSSSNTMASCKRLQKRAMLSCTWLSQRSTVCPMSQASQRAAFFKAIMGNARRHERRSRKHSNEEGCGHYQCQFSGSFKNLQPFEVPVPTVIA